MDRSAISVWCSVLLCTKWIWLINALQKAFKLSTVIVLDFLKNELRQFGYFGAINRLNASIKDLS